MATQRIKTFLWFNDNAEEAVNFYVSLFKNSKILTTHRWGDSGPGPKGSVMTMSFQLEGQEFVALNGGPRNKFTEAISLSVSCETQEEVDELWTKLTANGGSPSQCAWLKDKFGLSWQVVPTALGRYLSDPDRTKADRAMQAMIKMRKIVIADLDKAFAG